MRPRQRSLVGRDQAVSAFGAILLKLCDSTGAVGVALVDAEGETVDYAGTVDPYEMRVAAAEWRLVFSVLSASRVLHWGDTTELVVRAAHRSFVGVLLGEGYALVAELQLHCFSISRRALAECARDICNEAGFELPRGMGVDAHWTRVDVRTTRAERRRPVAIWMGGSWCALEILGRYARAELGRGEIGYRARLGTGAEITLVRERLGRWYAEDLPDVGRGALGS